MLACPDAGGISMPTRIARLAGGALLLALAACTVSPATQGAGGSAAAEPGSGLPRTSLICHAGATAVAFSQLGLPEGEIAVGMALTPESVWVLFQPARLVRVSRTTGGQVKVASRTGAPGEVWTGLAADEDGSIWIVARDFGLHHFGADLAPRGNVRLSREVIGESGLARLLAAGGILYAEPACGEYGSWRIAPDGKVLGTDFRAPQESGPIDPNTMNCARVSLLRDAAGQVIVLDGDQGKSFRAAADGTWAELDAAAAGLASCGPAP